MKPKKVTVTLTALEAEKLLQAAVFSLDRDPSGNVVFNGKKDWNAAARAHDKIQDALHP